MKKTILVALLGLAFSVPAFAGMNSDFKDHFNAAGFSQYNHDISTMIGMADFHTGKGTSFPGFDIGATVSAVKTADDNFSHEDYFYAPFITAETQIPVLGIGIAARGTSYNDFESLGGGLKWNGSLATVHFSAGLFYDRYKTDYYDGDHVSASASASVNLLFLTPYIGIGYDYSEMETKNLISHYKTDDDAVRYTLGANFHPFPFVYLYGAYTYTKNSQGFQAGLGVHF
ncbi:MAG: hypothetical protein IJ016_04200 [Elusimicrobiaceae bacterium]|nr:hypothetical protein [Elusimicrobiaceae bacterium]